MNFKIVKFHHPLRANSDSLTWRSMSRVEVIRGDLFARAKSTSSYWSLYEYNEISDCESRSDY